MRTLVLDLDETLIHCVDEGMKAEKEIHISLPTGKTCTAGINIRPGLLATLTKISEYYEIIVYTAGQKNYADAILDSIDPERKIIHYRLYREDCVEYSENIFIKDLRILGRDLTHIIIVDNSPYSFSHQLENGYPIVPFYDSKADGEMKKLESYLLKIKDLPDFREANRKKFDLKKLALSNLEHYIQYYSGSNSDGENEEPINDTGVVSTKINEVLKLIQISMATLFKK